MRSRATRSTSHLALGLAVAAALAAAGCGGDRDSASVGSTPASVGSAPAPDQALTLRAGDHTVTVAPAGGCVREGGRVVCGDPAPPTCADGSTARLPRPTGAVLVLGFAARPSRVEIVLAGARLALRPDSSEVRWDPALGRPAILSVLVELGSARLLYAACVVPTG